MRIVTIGDTHFQQGHWRNTDRLAAMDRILSEEGAHQPAAWIHLGDIWHAKASDDDLEVVADFLQRMAETAPVLLLLGNHGLTGYSRLMGRLKGRWPITVVDAPQVVHLATATGETVHIACLPYPHKGGLVAAGVAPGDVAREADHALDVLCMGLAADLAAAVGPKMLIAHATVSGATSSVGQPLGLEHDIAISAASLARFGDIPKIFGHIHRQQIIHGVHYAGSITANDWGETEEKRYLVVEFDDEQP